VSVGQKRKALSDEVSESLQTDAEALSTAADQAEKLQQLTLVVNMTFV